MTNICNKKKKIGYNKNQVYQSWLLKHGLYSNSDLILIHLYLPEGFSCDVDVMQITVKILLVKASQHQLTSNLTCRVPTHNI